jgi:hypothetical protein
MVIFSESEPRLILLNFSSKGPVFLSYESQLGLGKVPAMSVRWRCLPDNNGHVLLVEDAGPPTSGDCGQTLPPGAQHDGRHRRRLLLF